LTIFSISLFASFWSEPYLIFLNRVLKVDTELGYKWIADPHLGVKYLEESTKIIWGGKNLKVFDAYKFEW